MRNLRHQNLVELFEKTTGEESKTFTALPQSGSYREYYRITSDNHALIGVYNADRKENNAFLTFTRHFFAKGLRVPEVVAEQFDQDIYLLSDLGDITLFDYISDKRQDQEFTPDIVELYKRILEALPHFQITAGQDLDYSVCYPRASFDKQSMMWDLNYFKYYFLKLARIPFDEQKLEDDFQDFSDFLLEEKRDYFLYRDFQSRNIMIYQDQPYFIDYQGGRRGALQYDLASLLFDSKAEVPFELRQPLLDHYLDVLDNFLEYDRRKFVEYYQGFAMIRLMQAMGAYGFRGFYEKKTHFLRSIPHALNNLNFILQNMTLPVELPELMRVLKMLPEAPELQKFKDQKQIPNQLTVTINSFSYKTGIPVDTTGNGGGHIFDCRAVHNPGRYDRFKGLTGLDREVHEFFKKESEMDEFLQYVFTLVDQSVDKYLQRQFTNLMVNFGCTGGQHRSVYAAEALAAHLKEKYDIQIKLRHFEMERIRQKLQKGEVQP